MPAQQVVGPAVQPQQVAGGGVDAVLAWAAASARRLLELDGTDDRIVVLRADEAALDVLLRNLLGNALRHTRRGGVLMAARRTAAASSSRTPRRASRVDEPWNVRPMCQSEVCRKRVIVVLSGILP